MSALQDELDYFRDASARHLIELIDKDKEIEALQARIKELEQETTTLGINLKGVSKHKKQLQQRIKELEGKLNNEWKDIKDIEAEIDRFSKGQQFDLWVEERCPYQGCLINSYRVSDCHWVNSFHKWRCSLDRKVAMKNIAITHGRIVPTPPLSQEEGNE